MKFGAIVQNEELHKILDLFFHQRQFPLITNLLPFATLGRLRNLGILRAIDDDVFGHDTALDFAHLRMLTTPTEQRRRFNFEVANLLFVAVDGAKTVLLEESLVLCF